MRIEGGSMNFSRVPGQYAYQVRNYRNDPVERVDVLRKTESAGDYKPVSDRQRVSDDRNEPSLYFPQIENFHQRHSELMKGRFLDVLI